MTIPGLDADYLRYRAILNPLFIGGNCDPVEYAASLLRMGGLEDAGWDTLLESEQTLQDLTNLMGSELPPAKFCNPDHTRLRLRLLAYAHLVEMDAPYEIIANLCRVKAGQDCTILPFHDHSKINTRPTPLKPGKKPKRASPIHPAMKIDKIKALSKAAGVPEVGEVFSEFYFPVIRNSINHSDYIIHGAEFRLRKSHFPTDDPQPVLSQVIPIRRLELIIDKAFSFYNAFFGLERAARQWFSTMKGKAIPYDLPLKGLLEFLLDGDGLLCGFKVHWPNRSESTYRRTAAGSDATNLHLALKGVHMFVGEYPRDHDSFSRLVERGKQPQYTPAEGSTEPLRWPDKVEGSKADGAA